MKVNVIDNGIGMTREELWQHYWRAGSSSKNTADARAAGVVGTFGIGAMANFGIAEELTGRDRERPNG
jgi:molecular chaperone HtpG